MHVHEDCVVYNGLTTLPGARQSILLFKYRIYLMAFIRIDFIGWSKSKIEARCHLKSIALCIMYIIEGHRSRAIKRRGRDRLSLVSQPKALLGDIMSTEANSKQMI